jgi:Protein of unknown function (DUF2933)
VPRSTALLAIIVVLIGAALIASGNDPHVIGYLPYLVLLACPLMHMFMHHGHHRDQDGERSRLGK